VYEIGKGNKFLWLPKLKKVFQNPLTNCKKYGIIYLFLTENEKIFYKEHIYYVEIGKVYERKG
jgi:hypothetical protein